MEVPLVPPRGSAEEARRPGATPELREAHPAPEASPATNQSGSYGGGLYVTGATVPAQVSNSVISGNRTPSSLKSKGLGNNSDG